MAVELGSEFGRRAPVTITPVAEGRLEIYLNGEKVFDRKEDGHYPGLDRLRQIKRVIRERLEGAPA
ncbi:MAG: hypothetical protein HYX89_07560 [Chloroflexi bacterium]|nr:hypothetical protein [Chloroflexota bacterium]